MTTAAVSPEKLAELKTEEAKPETTSAPEVTPAIQEAAKEASTSAAGASGDVAMSEEDKKDKALRAVRQSALNCLSGPGLLFPTDLPCYSRVLLC